VGAIFERKSKMAEWLCKKCFKAVCDKAGVSDLEVKSIPNWTGHKCFYCGELAVSLTEIPNRK
jgi:hypothetical protein